MTRCATCVGRSQYAKWLALTLALTALICSSLGAQIPEDVPDLARTSWRVQEGLPENTVQAIQQTSSGHLWIGTTGGAVRFDGARFSLVAGAAEGSIFSMLAARDGSLWFGTEGAGLLHLYGGDVTMFSNEQGLADGFLRAILKDHAGRIWVGKDNGLFWVSGGRARQVETSSLTSQLSVHALVQDSSGRIWVGGSKLLVFPSSADPEYGSAAVVSYSLPGDFSENASIRFLRQAHNLWIWYGRGAGPPCGWSMRARCTGAGYESHPCVRLRTACYGWSPLATAYMFSGRAGLHRLLAGGSVDQFDQYGANAV